MKIRSLPLFPSALVFLLSLFLAAPSLVLSADVKSVASLGENGFVVLKDTNEGTLVEYYRVEGGKIRITDAVLVQVNFDPRRNQYRESWLPVELNRKDVSSFP